MVNEFAKALVEDRDPWPNARTHNWTCVGICAHESAGKEVLSSTFRVYTSVGMDVRLKYFSVLWRLSWQVSRVLGRAAFGNSQCLLYRGAVCQNAPLGTAHA